MLGDAPPDYKDLGKTNVTTAEIFTTNVRKRIAPVGDRHTTWKELNI